MRVLHVLAKLGAASVFAATLITGAHAQEVCTHIFPMKARARLASSDNQL